MPPIVFRAARRMAKGHIAETDQGENRPSYGFVGDYPSFDAAAAVTTGYATETIARASADRLSALLPRADDTRIDERFLQVHSALAFVAAAGGVRRLSVLDVGGGNGSYYFVMKRLLPNVELAWTVLETPPMVAACRAAGDLPFSLVSDLAETTGHFDVVLISGALQYLPDPYQALPRYAAIARWLIATRIPVIDGDADRFTVQIVPPDIHEGSMPVWLFSATKLANALAAIGTTVMEWAVSPDSGFCATVGAHPRGFLVKTS
jgi:putative methyltransferase (TIGR04325 family)